MKKARYRRTGGVRSIADAEEQRWYREGSTWSRSTEGLGYSLTWFKQDEREQEGWYLSGPYIDSEYCGTRILDAIDEAVREIVRIVGHVEP